MSTWHRLSREERGSALTYALVALAVGTMLITPLLAHVGSGYRTTESSRQAINTQYASDAGIEYAMWKLMHDSSFRQTLLDNEDAVQTLTLPSNVNGNMPTVEAVCVSKQTTGGGGGGGEGGVSLLQWAIWANSQTANQTVKNSGAGHIIRGGVHSNNTIQISGAGNKIYGPVEYAGAYPQIVGVGHEIVPGPPDNPVQTPARAYPLTWDIADFRPGGKYAVQAAAEGKYYQITDLNVTTSGVMAPGLYYCSDKASITGAGVQAISVTIVAEDTINVAGAGINITPYIPGLVFFSPKASSANVISISGAGNKNGGGVFYAPNGKISLDGAGNTIVGAFMGNEVQITGSGAVISNTVVYVTSGAGGGGGTTTCGEYDIRSTLGSTTVGARVTECEGEGLTIKSWTVN